MQDNQAIPGSSGKIVAWLKHHGYIGSLQKTLKVKIKSSTSSMADANTSVPADTNAVTVARTKMPNVVPVKCIPPWRTKSDARILKNDKVICTSREMMIDDNESGLPNGDGCPSKESSGGIEKVIALIISCLLAIEVVSLMNGGLDNQ